MTKRATPQADHDAAPASGAPKRGFFSSKLLWLALTITALGVGWTIFLTLDQPDAPHSVPSDAVRGLADAASPTPAPREPTLAERVAPATARFGMSFVLGYAVGWLLRRALKAAAVLALVAVAVLYLLKKFGVLVDPATVEQSVEAAGEWVRSEGAQFKDFRPRLRPQRNRRPSGRLHRRPAPLTRTLAAPRPPGYHGRNLRA